MRKAWMTVAILLIGLLGCVTEPNANQSSSERYIVIQEILSGVDFLSEDAANITLFLRFEDGRLQKCRLRYDNPVQFCIGKLNRVKIDKSNSNLVEATWEEGATKRPPALGSTGGLPDGSTGQAN